MIRWGHLPRLRTPSGIIRLTRPQFSAPWLACCCPCCWRRSIRPSSAPRNPELSRLFPDSTAIPGWRRRTCCRPPLRSDLRQVVGHVRAEMVFPGWRGRLRAYVGPVRSLRQATFLGLDGMNQLILFRACRVSGGGVMMGLAFTIIGDVFSPAERGKYQGFFAAMCGVASIFGPTLGGWLTDQVLLARDLLREPAGGRHRHRRDVSLFPVLASEGVHRRDRLGRCLRADLLHGAAAARAHLGRPSTAGPPRASISCWRWPP